MTSILDATVKSVVAGKNPGTNDGGGKKGGLGKPLSEEEKKTKWVTHPIIKTNTFAAREMKYGEDAEEEGGGKYNNPDEDEEEDDEDEEVASNTTRGVATATTSGWVEAEDKQTTMTEVKLTSGNWKMLDVQIQVGDTL